MPGRSIAASRLAEFLGWALALLATILFALALPARYRQLLDAPPAVRTQLESLGLTVGFNAGYLTAVSLTFGLGCLAVALLLTRSRDEPGMRRFTALFLVLLGTLNVPNIAAIQATYPGLSLLGEIALYALLVCFTWFLLHFPDGKPVVSWASPAAVAWAGAFGLVLLATGGSTVTLGPAAVEIVLLVGLAAGLGSQLYRYARVSSPGQRQQTKWVVLGVVAALLLQALVMFLRVGTLAGTEWRQGPFDPLNVTLVTAGYFLVPLTIGLAVLRYRLWLVDLFIRRAVVAAVLTGCVAVLYVVTVALFGLLANGGNVGAATPVLITALVAVLFQPLRRILERGANRLLYGRRDEPYAVLSRLSRRLEASVTPDVALQTVVEAVSAALRLPFAAVRLTSGAEFTAGDSAVLPGHRKTLRLVHQGVAVGELEVAPRSKGEEFDAADRELLEELARQAGTAAHAAQLVTELRRSRQRLVNAREEERRRLRRDLHDHLGAELAGQVLKVGSARMSIRSDLQGAFELLAELEGDMVATLKSLRRVVYHLRPPAIDELGLAGALSRLLASREVPGKPAISLDCEEELAGLPAAVEAAAYLIVQEAVANVQRHSGARNCWVRLAAGDELTVEVRDDGAGLASDTAHGVGLISMRERAEELRGTLELTNPAGGGTRVVARLPREPDASG